MPASEARIAANRQNAQHSCGPKTPEGKERSRANSYKHGLTGAGVVLPEPEAAEVERRVLAFEAELRPSGAVGLTLARLAATMSVRMDRCFEQENAALTERVRQAEADFVPPEGVDDATAERLRTEAGKRALFDVSKDACLARKYEASAIRGFFRALKELRVVEKAAQADEAAIEEQVYRETLASFSQIESAGAGLAPPKPVPAPSTPRNRIETLLPGDLPSFESRIDVPFAIGKPR
jgi:hypothetical protein